MNLVEMDGEQSSLMSLDEATPLPGRTDHRMINSVTMAGTIIMVMIHGIPTTLSGHNGPVVSWRTAFVR